MWKPEHRLAADRRGLRYPSDLTDAEWAIVAAMIPPGRHGGRRRSVNVREVLNGIFYVLWTGCRWRALPKDLPRLRTLRNDRFCIHPPRHDPHHAQATCRKCLAINPNFP